MQIDGRISDSNELRSYIDVIRIGGDESVVSQIRNRVRGDEAVVDRCAMAFESIADETQASLRPLIDEFDALAGMSFLDADNAVTIAREALTKSESKFRDESQRKRDIETLIRVSELRKEQSRLGPEVKARYDAAKDKVDKLTSERKETAEKLRQLVPRTAALALLQERLDQLERLHRGRRERAARTAARAQRAAHTAGVAIDDAETLLNQVRRQRLALLRDRSALASMPELLELAEDLRSPLADVENSDLDDEVVAIVDVDTRVSAGELRRGIDRRSEELTENMAYAQLAKIDDQIKDLDSRFFELHSVVIEVRDAQRKADLLSKVEVDIDQVAEKLRQSTDNSYASLSSRLEDLDRDLADAIQRQAELRIHLDHIGARAGPNSLLQTIADLESRLGIASDEAPTVHPDIARLTNQLAEEVLRHRSHLKETEDSRRALNAAFGRILQLVTKSSELEWLRSSLPTLHNLGTGLDRRTAYERLMHIAEAVRTVQSRIDMSLAHIATIQDSLRNIQDSIARHRRPPTNPLNRAFIQRYEKQMTEFLSNPTISDSIFEGGTFERFHLVEGFVAWRTKEGSLRRRPIEAFSSGERAFAYMLAAILGHQEDSDAKCRVFVLDEFGAFVEEDRRSRLWNFLDERLLKVGLAQQVVVILPSRAHSEISRLSDQIEANGYFAIEAPL
ncbi:MAG: hypothetical protein OXG64_00545 [Chloroflexi bacterium]|nr:hypothetical protein [Chloroflexota bacterium]